MIEALGETNFILPGQTGFYRGKVRDVYQVKDLLVMVTTDRISAFDHILPRAVPYKGQVLNQIAALFLNETRNIVPNWLVSTPDPNVSIGYACEPIKIEMVIRGYLAGHAWRVYRSGQRLLCGVRLPEGMREGDRFPQPIITPATKADAGHDEDISKAEILDRKLVSEAEYEQLEQYTRALFNYGTREAAEKGLLLVDTKYEFGKRNGRICVIDEIHTPDSSRYYYREGYAERQAQGISQKQLSKEFVREWLMSEGFQGKEGQMVPPMPDDFVTRVSNRYIELFEHLTGQPFEKIDNHNMEGRIFDNIMKALQTII